MVDSRAKEKTRQRALGSAAGAHLLAGNAKMNIPEDFAVLLLSQFELKRKGRGYILNYPLSLLMGRRKVMMREYRPDVIGAAARADEWPKSWMVARRLFRAFLQPANVRIVAKGEELPEVSFHPLLDREAQPDHEFVGRLASEGEIPKEALWKVACTTVQANYVLFFRKVLPDQAERPAVVRRRRKKE